MIRKLALAGTLAGTTVAAGALVTAESTRHLPPNPGGRVDVEINSGQHSSSTVRHDMMRELSSSLTQVPPARRLRIRAVWGDCGVSGRVVVVYDRSSASLTCWEETTNERYGSRCSRTEFERVPERTVHAVAALDPRWYRRVRVTRYFDGLAAFGCRKVPTRL